jgi:hypothetical protein
MTRDLWKTADGKFDAGAASVETWIPDGGFEIQRRKVKGSDGNPIIADCLVPKWPDVEVFSSRPCHEEPCLHRILAECQPGGVLSFADNYGLLAFSVPRHLAGKKVHAGDVLQPEPLTFWQEEIGLLRRLTGLWDSILANERKTRTKMDEAELRRRLRQPDDAKRADLIRPGAQTPRPGTHRQAGRREVRFDRLTRGRERSFRDPLPAVEAHRRPLAALRRGDRRPDRVRQVPGPRLRPLVPAKRRAQRQSLLLSRLPDAGVADYFGTSSVTACPICANEPFCRR